MSSIQNRIVTTFVASAGNAISVMNQIAGGMMNIGRQSEQTGRQLSVVEQQMRALGTTIRYAFAGAAVFAIPSMIRNLSQVQQQLGLMAAIGSQPGGIAYTGQAIRQLGFDAQAGAVAAITPVQDFNNAVVNFLSTVQDVPQDQITPIVTQIAQAAQLAQISAEDATKAFTTMNVAFGRPTNLRNIRNVAQEFFILTREAPGGVAAGQQVVQQLGQLAQVTRAARGTPEDMFSLLLTTLRTGIPPAQAGRGLQYLIQTLAFPGQGTAESQAALASVGIQPGGNLPLQERLNRIFTHARQLGIRGDIGRISKLDESQLDELDTTGGGLTQLGITGRGAVFLGQIFHRIHALRTALALSTQGIGVQGTQAAADLKSMSGVVQGHVRDVDRLDKAWTRFREQAKLREASVAIQTMGLQVAQTFEPVLNFVAGKATSLSEVAHRHPRATRDVTIGAAGIVAALGVGRFFGIRGAGGVLGRLSGLGGGAIVRGKAVEDALKGATAPGLSPQNPLYVIVVGQLFGGQKPLTDIRPPGGGGGRSWFSKFGGFAEGLGVGAASKFPAAARLGARFGPAALTLAAETPAAGDIIAIAEGKDPFKVDYSLRRGPTISTEQRNKFYQAISQQARGFLGVFGGGGSGRGQIVGRADVNIDLTSQGRDGKVTTKRVHVPMDLWAGGKAPQTKGKQKATRR